jgi:hypothetical protein
MASQINAAIVANLNTVNFIGATGSVDGVLTSAALIGYAEKDCGLQFMQAFTVDKVDPTKWAPGRRVALVDLAVNNRKATKPGEIDGLQMTTDFVRRILAAGHQLVAICDEHNAADWRLVCEATGIDFESLLILPCTQGNEGNPKSSGALLLANLGDQASEHVTALCRDADAADKMDFSGPFASMVNKAVKSAITDDSRRIYLAKHLAVHSEADSKIQGWIEEYAAIEANHEVIVANRKDLGDGIIEVVTTGKVDMTSLMARLYKLGRCVVSVGEAFNKDLGRKALTLSFGIPTGKGDVLAALTAAGLPASGFKEKANIALPADETERKLLISTATEAVRAWLKAQS